VQRNLITFTLTWPYFPPDVVVVGSRKFRYASFLRLADENTFCVKYVTRRLVLRHFNKIDFVGGRSGGHLLAVISQGSYAYG